MMPSTTMLVFAASVLFFGVVVECGPMMLRYPASPMEALERLRSRYYILPQQEYPDEGEEYLYAPQWRTAEEDEYNEDMMRNYLMEQQQQQAMPILPEIPRNYLMAGQQQLPGLLPDVASNNYLMQPQQQVQRRSDVTLPTSSPPSPPPVQEARKEATHLEAGQKEEEPWHKSPILKQLIGGEKKKDTLLQELDDLKKRA